MYSSTPDIKQLIPQREPILMIDNFNFVGEKECSSSLKIFENNIFCDAEHLMEVGIIEHTAQTAAAYVGYLSYIGGFPIRLGYIGEVKKFHLNSLPAVGETIITTLHVLSQINNITLVGTETKVGEFVIATGKMKIAMEQ